MADFGRLGEVVGRAMGLPDDTFLSLYLGNRRDAARDSLDEWSCERLRRRFGPMGYSLHSEGWSRAGTLRIARGSLTIILT